MGIKLKPPLLYWHLLSLDAPTVATLWTWFIARTNHVSLPASSLVAMTAAVWMLYAADRLLDTRGESADVLEARHHFHYRHSTTFLVGIGGASVLLAATLPSIPSEAIRLYLVLGGMVFGYFVIIHASQSAHRLPKEIAVGVCFAAAVFIPTVAREPSLRAVLLPPALLFATLCSLNCLFIFVWEHPTGAVPPPHPVTAVMLTRLPTLTAIAGGIAALFAIFDHRVPWPIAMATTLSCAVLLMVHFSRSHYDKPTLRILADLALLTPALLAGFL